MRQMFDQRRAASPVGWDKSYPLDPVSSAAVEAVNPEVRTPLYKQNVSRANSYNKYSGNYGPRAGQGAGQYGKRGMSLDRSKGRGDSRLGYTPLSRAHSQANLGSSSEDSYPGSRPYSGLGYSASGNLRNRKPSGSGSQGGLTRSGYVEPVSPEDSPPAARKSYQTLGRDYTRPMPPAYRRQKSMSRMTEPSPSRHSYHQVHCQLTHLCLSLSPGLRLLLALLPVVRQPLGQLGDTLRLLCDILCLPRSEQTAAVNTVESQQGEEC